MLFAATLSSLSGAVLEKERFYQERTETLKVRITGEPLTGVLLLKHYKSGNPVFIVSAFEESSVVKTSMVTRARFFEIFEQLLSALPKSDRKAEEDCDRPVEIEMRAEGLESQAQQICLDAAPEVTAKLGTWYLHIKEKL